MFVSLEAFEVAVFFPLRYKFRALFLEGLNDSEELLVIYLVVTLSGAHFLGHERY